MMYLLANDQAVSLGALASVFLAAIIGTLFGGSGILVVWVQYFRQRELESFKSKLAMEATEHQIRFAHYHQHMAETVGDVYAKFLEIRDALMKIVTIELAAADPRREEGRKEFNNDLLEFQKYFRPRRIFLPRAMSDDIWNAVEQAQNIEWDVPPGSSHQEYTKAWQRLGKDIGALQKQLETRFRDALGVGEEGDIQNENPDPT